MEDQFHGLSTCVCVVCGKIFFRSGKEICLNSSTRLLRNKFTPDRLVTMLMNRPNTIIKPDNYHEKAFLLTQLCDDCFISTTRTRASAR